MPPRAVRRHARGSRRPAGRKLYLSGRRTAPQKFLDDFLDFLSVYGTPIDDTRRGDLHDLRRAAQAAGSASEQVLVLQEFLEQARSIPRRSSSLRLGWLS
ncbi:hypothetical protein ACFV1W_40025 [Kitasatospora sp. NPDC059648]|uniref:hypothetical protein n=1 Tax=Kitasatospora sp. NPDC059648 TaxID=3346894 RepID=UPI0036BE03AA